MHQYEFSLRSKSLTDLKLHPVKIESGLHPRKPVIRVQNHHFNVISVDVRKVSGFLFLGENQASGWHRVEEKDLSSFKEGVQTALYALYVLNIPEGECIVQRESSRTYSIYDIHPYKNRISEILMRPNERFMSFGADVECLLQNKKTGHFVSASSFVEKDGEIGYDDAIALIDKKVIHPILELRPKPASDGMKLHTHILHLFEKTECFLRNNQLQSVTSPLGRFQAGGHLHVGNCPLTFYNVRLLDTYLAVPLALTEFEEVSERRKRFGRLGSVLPNAFSGFEYRVLSSWYKKIPKFKPVLEWFSYLLIYSNRFPLLDFSDDMLIGYYEHHLLMLQEVVSRIEKICREAIPDDDFSRYGKPFFQLIRQMGDVL